MIKVDTNSYAITLPVGDTGILAFEIEALNTQDQSVIDESRDKCVFSILHDGQDIPSTVRILPIVDGVSTLRFTNSMTDSLESGNYNWNLRVCINPQYNDSETEIVDADEVHSPLSILTNGRLPKLKLLEVGVDV